MCVCVLFLYVHSSMHYVFTAELNILPFQSHVKQKEKRSFSLPFSLSLLHQLLPFQIESNHNAFARHRIQATFLVFSPSAVRGTDRCARLLKFIICSLCFLMSFRFFAINPSHRLPPFTSHARLIAILLLASIYSK